MDTISDIINQCLKEFAALTTSSALAKYEGEVPCRRWFDELGRLRVWTGNIGAHQVGQSSLTYRLRDSSHLKNEIIRLLCRLSRVLQDLAVVIHEEDDDCDQETCQIEIENDEEKDEATTEVQQLYRSLVDILGLLFQISMAIRRPADHDRLMGMKFKNESYFEPWARQHVSHKHSDAEPETIARLGAAMARQKAILKYRERHRAKLGQGLAGELDTKSVKLSETVATELPHKDQFHFVEIESDSGVSQTSYATSLMPGQVRTSVPNPPKESADGAPFECPYCFHIVKIKNSRDWAHHVFRDLMPYVCLAKDCPTPSRLYESRSQWCCHMKELHPTITGTQASFVCPLCWEGVTVPSTFEKHVGRHLEELALFVLPRAGSNDEENIELSAEAVSGHDVGEGESDSGGYSNDQVDAELEGQWSGKSRYLSSTAPQLSKKVIPVSLEQPRSFSVNHQSQMAKKAEDTSLSDFAGVAYPSDADQLSHTPRSNFGILGDSSDSKNKRRRGSLPKPITDILRAWFHEHLDHPYPSEEDKQMFMMRTGLTISQISNWFVNARRRQRDQMRNGDADLDAQRQSPFSDVDQTSESMPSPHQLAFPALRATTD